MKLILKNKCIKYKMSKFESLSPLRKWVISNKYFIKTNESKERKSKATHFLLDGGIWEIPKGFYLEFLKILSMDLQNGEKHYITELRTPLFRFICDLDFYDTSEIVNIESYVTPIQEIINEFFGESCVIICSTDTKQVKINEIEHTKTGFHLIWPKLWVNVNTAKTLRILFIEKLTSIFGERPEFNSWSEVVDLAVYEDNGLRMVGCRKIGFCKGCKNKKESRETCLICNGTGKLDEGRVYKPKCVLNGQTDYFKTISTDYYVLLLETSIYNYANVSETKLQKDLPILNLTKKKQSSKKEKETKDSEDPLVAKVENFIKKNFKQSKIKIKKLVKSENIYFAEPDDNFCMNVNRNHTSSGVYFQIKPSGVSQRCYCKKESTDGRLNGPCTTFCSKEISISKILQNALFGIVKKESKKDRKINSYNISRNSSTSALDLSVAGVNYMFNPKQICLENCKNILFQLEKELK